LTVERIVNEPTAAALAYGLGRLAEHSKIAVYDLGGGTFDLSILELNAGVFQVLSTNGNTRLGGDDLDKRLVDSSSKKSRLAADRMRPAICPCVAHPRSCRECQNPPLDRDGSGNRASFLSPDYHFQLTLRREELEDLTRDILLRTRPHCLRSLADAKLEAKDLDQVILVGGQTRMPLVRRIAAEIFGCAEFDEARGDIRLGADYHAASGPRLNTRRTRKKRWRWARPSRRKYFPADSRMSFCSTSRRFPWASKPSAA